MNCQAAVESADLRAYLRLVVFGALLIAFVTGPRSASCAVFRCAMGGNDLEDKPVPLRKGLYLRKTDSGGQCGAYSLAAALRAVGVDTDMEELLDGKVVTSAKGSSGQDLIDASTRLGVNAVPLRNVTVSFLKSSEFPVLLLLSRSRQQEASNHWITFLGDDDGMATIFDAPHPIQRIEYAELMALWTGVGVVIGDDEKNEVPNHGTTAILDVATWLSFPVAVVLVLLTFKFDEKLRWVNRIALILSSAAIWAQMHHMLSPNGFLNQPLALSLVARDYLPVDVHTEVDTDAVRNLLGSSHVRIVDARLPSDFEKGHIAGAINLPIDASFGELRSAMDQISRNQTVIVYCQSPSCVWSDVVASWLRHAGHDKIAVYKGGWYQWRMTISNQ